MKKVEHLIKEVYPGSIAEELEIESGDVLLSICLLYTSRCV